MKKLLILILAFCMVLPLAACGKGDDADKPAKLEISSWAFHGFEKTIVTVKPGSSKTNTDYTVYLAKGETEGCQVAIYANQQMKNITFNQASGENENIKTAMFSMDHAHVCSKKKEYTDSLVPYYGKRLQLEAGRTLPFR